MLFVGDIHRKFDVIFDHCIKYGYKGNIFQVGDFGIGFNKESWELDLIDSINNTMKLLECTLYVIRGNHDDPKYFKEHKYDKSNLIFIEDYEVIELEGKKIFCLGGGISVDRIWRTEGIDYWQNEGVSFNEKKIPSYPIDIIVTHIKPTFAPPNGRYPHFIYTNAMQDKKLLNDLLMEGNRMEIIYNKLNKSNLTNYFYGHYHESFSYKHNDGVDFKCLNENEFFEMI